VGRAAPCSTDVPTNLTICSYCHKSISSASTSSSYSLLDEFLLSSSSDSTKVKLTSKKAGTKKAGTRDTKNQKGAPVVEQKEPSVGKKLDPSVGKKLVPKIATKKQVKLTLKKAGTKDTKNKKGAPVEQKEPSVGKKLDPSVGKKLVPKVTTKKRDSDSSDSYIKPAKQVKQSDSLPSKILLKKSQPKGLLKEDNAMSSTHSLFFQTRAATKSR
jgi:hypothetical protein